MPVYFEMPLDTATGEGGENMTIRTGGIEEQRW
jgi:hypothetical protein